MDHQTKINKYNRIITQLTPLLAKSSDEQARMASVVALIHYKMPHFFWSGFYELKQGRLIVKLYQGPIACMELPVNTGVCWAAINSAKPVVVANVHEFPGHIACDSRSKSEICIPYKNAEGLITAVLDIDSDNFDNFDDIDVLKLCEILELIHSVEAFEAAKSEPA
ncbi:MAG: GAF domain-containing protein [Anaerolineae bacterium]|nr:GAF domain-containing protein [Anaerolineae bacterium]